jgi:hypothetical protein
MVVFHLKGGDPSGNGGSRVVESQRQRREFGSGNEHSIFFIYDH